MRGRGSRKGEKPTLMCLSPVHDVQHVGFGPSCLGNGGISVVGLLSQLETNGRWLLW